MDEFNEQMKSINSDINGNYIMMYIKNSGGVLSSIFLDELFENILSIHLERLRDPSLACVHNAMKELIYKCVNVTVEHYVKQFPFFMGRLKHLMLILLQNEMPRILKMINMTIDIEFIVPNLFSSPRFLEILQNVKEKNLPIEAEYAELINGYFAFVKEKITDSVGKISKLLLNRLKDQLVKNTCELPRAVNVNLVPVERNGKDVTYFDDDVSIAADTLENSITDKEAVRKCATLNRIIRHKKKFRCGRCGQPIKKSKVSTLKQQQK
jgi:ribosomal protein S27AE